MLEMIVPPVILRTGWARPGNEARQLCERRPLRFSVSLSSACNDAFLCSVLVRG